jgi:RNA polymerase sigma factor (sigma-70 family)
MTTMEFSTKLVSLEDNLERFALSLTSNREEAKDLLQETYLKALTYSDKFIEYTNLKAWAYTIMKNIFINNYRKSVREYTTLDNTKDLFLYNAKESQLVRPESEYAFKEINKEIDALEDEWKVPFRMYTEGYKYREIAEILKLNIGTVKSRIYFTRKKLVEVLQDYK